MSTFRSIISTLGPNWLVRDVASPYGTAVETASRVLWPIMALYDAGAQRIHLGIKARFPGGGSTADSLTYLGRDRQIVRGPTEPRTGYELRLQRAFDDWKLAGNAWAVLEQLRAYLTPHECKVSLVNNHGRWRTIEADGTRTRDNTSAWNWDGSTEQWSRYWILIYMTGSPLMPWQRAATWGSGQLWGTAGKTWGSSATPEEVQAVRRIVSTWKHAGSRCVNICICFDSTLGPDATSPPGPDGLWGNWSKNVGGVQVPARSSSAIYWRGTS